MKARFEKQGHREKMSQPELTQTLIPHPLLFILSLCSCMYDCVHGYTCMAKPEANFG